MGTAETWGGGGVRTVLVVDDDEDQLTSLAAALETHMQDAEIVTARTAEEALATIRSRTIDLVLTDQHLPGANGMDVVRAVRHGRRDVPCILVTGYPGLDLALEAHESGARVDGILPKPVDADALRRSLVQALSRRAS